MQTSTGFPALRRYRLTGPLFRYCRHLLIVAPALLLGACALSPQYVEIDPDIKVDHQLPVAHVVQLNIEDNRDQTHFGTRGGAYADTSFIHPSESLADSLRPAAIEALQTLGLDTQGRSPMPVQLTLIVDKLNYQMDDRTLPKIVTLGISIRARVDKGPEHYEGRFSSSKSHNFMTSPSELQNREIINELLSETLTRVFNDPRILEHLR